MSDIEDKQLRISIADVLMKPNQAWRGMKKIPIELIWGFEDLIESEVKKARINELKQLEPPEQYKEYAIIMGSESCQICGFNSEVFRKHILDRINSLEENK